MTVTAKWTAPESIASALTTELNSLTDGSVCTASAAIDNETDLYQYIELELVLASLTPTGVPYMVVLIQYTLDGTNYNDNTETGSPILGTCQFSTGVAAKRNVFGPFVIAPLKFKLSVVNHAGVTLAASGNTLKYRRHNEQGV